MPQIWVVAETRPGADKEAHGPFASQSAADDWLALCKALCQLWATCPKVVACEGRPADERIKAWWAAPK